MPLMAKKAARLETEMCSWSAILRRDSCKGRVRSNPTLWRAASRRAFFCSALGRLVNRFLRSMSDSRSATAGSTACWRFKLSMQHLHQPVHRTDVPAYMLLPKPTDHRRVRAVFPEGLSIGWGLTRLGVLRNGRPHSFFEGLDQGLELDDSFVGGTVIESRQDAVPKLAAAVDHFSQ